MQWAGLAGPVRDRGRVPGKRRTPPVLPVPCDVLRPIGGKRRSDGADGHSCDVLLARLATTQSGVVGRKQLLALGFTADEIDHRLETQAAAAGPPRRLRRRPRGPERPRALHRGAARRRTGRRPQPPDRPGALEAHPLDAAVDRGDADATKTAPAQPASRIHQAQRIETTINDGLPVTTPAQTLKDVPDRRATAEALYRGLIDRTDTEHEPTQSELEDIAAARPRRKPASPRR